MRAGKVRSGLTETSHEIAVATAGIGPTLAVGDVTRPFFLRSAAKPFQAWVSQDAGAVLRPEELALATASHGGEPVHVALVRAILEDAGLDESHLQCPPDWPRGAAARARMQAAGHRRPRPIFHNCSGKHAAMLRACASRGWPLEGYMEAEHPLQQRIATVVGEVLEADPGPLGIDGCGVPTYRASVRSMATAFALLAREPRFAAVRSAMHRFAPLTAGTGLPETELARLTPAAAKGGAEGCVGVAFGGRLGIAAKVWDGSSAPAVAAIVSVLDDAGLISPWQREQLAAVALPPVMGGGVPVGRLQVGPLP